MQKQKSAVKSLIFALAAGIISIGCNESELKTLQKSCVKDRLNAACEKLCDLNNSNGADGCFNLAMLYEAEKDFVKASRHYQKACDLGSASGCNNVGWLYTVGFIEGQFVGSDFAKAFSYYTKSCDLDYAPACKNLGVLYEYGKSVEQDFTKAFSFYKKACDLDFANGCLNLGVLYANGQGVKLDDTKAKKLFGKACDLGSQLSCDVDKVFDKHFFNRYSFE